MSLGHLDWTLAFAALHHQVFWVSTCSLNLHTPQASREIREAQVFLYESSPSPLPPTPSSQLAPPDLWQAHTQLPHLLTALDNPLIPRTSVSKGSRQGPHGAQPVPKTQIMAGAPADKCLPRGAGAHSSPEAETLLMTTWVLGPMTRGPNPARSELEKTQRVTLPPLPTPRGPAKDMSSSLAPRVAWPYTRSAAGLAGFGGRRKLPLVWLNLPRPRRRSAENTDNAT